MTPDDRKYTKEHEWVRLDASGGAIVGITQFAQEQLGDLVFFGPPKAGAKLKQFDKLGEVESVKAVSDIFAPVGGEVTEVNGLLKAQPGLVNQDPYGKGWLAKLKLSNPKDLDKLMSAKDYDTFLKGQAHSH